MTASRPTVHRLDSRDAWLAARRIGSSDAAAILGLSSYRTEWDVFVRLTTGRQDDSPSQDAARGRRLEPTVLRAYTHATGTRVRPTPAHTLWTREEWASSTPDALSLDRRLVIEAKTDRIRERWGEPSTIERWTREAERVVRPAYYVQVQHQLWTLDLELADLAVLLPGDDPFIPELRVYRLLRDEEVVASLVSRLSSWWRRHILTGDPPELDGSEAASRWLATQDRSKSRRATRAEVELAAAYETARQAAKSWDTYRRRVGQQLVASAGGYRELTMPVGRVAVVTSRGREQLDVQALLEHSPHLSELLSAFKLEGEPYSYPRISGLEKS